MRHTLLYTVIVFALFSPAVMNAQDTRSYEQRKAQLEKEMAILDAQLKENASKSRNALSELSLLRTRISNRKALVAESERQIRRYSDSIYLSQKQINRLEAQLDTLSAYYKRLVGSAYRNRDAKIWYMYILASEDLGQAFRRYSYFKNLSSQMKRQADKIRVTRAEIDAERSRLVKLKAEAETVRSARRKELNSLQADEKQSVQVVNQLKRSRTMYERQLSEKKRQVEALDREIKRIIAEAMKSAEGKGGGTSSGGQVDYKLAAEFSKNKGKLPWPAQGPVVDEFGQHYHPVFTRLKLPFNNGINIALQKGTEIKAVFDGVVKQIVVMPGYNQCVLVQHGNYFSFYCKLKSTSVKAGDKVRTGQKIGVVDTINGETQLHFQIWQNQSPQNPEVWLR